MTPEQREHRDQQITEFRYQLVAELANPYLSATERRELIRHKAQVQHEVPFLGRRRYSVGCIHKWLALYRRHGRAGLAPRARRDAGRARSLSDTEAAVLLNYLENHPELTATAALRTLQTDGRVTGAPSSSALSRLVRSAGLHRTARQRQAHTEQNLKFEFFAPLECVQADLMYGPRLPDAKGRRRIALLLAFLDDATRRVQPLGRRRSPQLRRNAAPDLGPATAASHRRAGSLPQPPPPSSNFSATHPQTPFAPNSSTPRDDHMSAFHADRELLPHRGILRRPVRGIPIYQIAGANMGLVDRNQGGVDSLRREFAVPVRTVFNIHDFPALRAE